MCLLSVRKIGIMPFEKENKFRGLLKERSHIEHSITSLLFLKATFYKLVGEITTPLV